MSYPCSALISRTTPSKDLVVAGNGLALGSCLPKPSQLLYYLPAPRYFPPKTDFVNANILPVGPIHFHILACEKLYSKAH